jgi:hypothetical protein
MAGPMISWDPPRDMAGGGHSVPRQPSTPFAWNASSTATGQHKPATSHLCWTEARAGSGRHS